MKWSALLGVELQVTERLLLSRYIFLRSRKPKRPKNYVIVWLRLGINKLKTNYDDPVIIIGGDTNNRSLDNMLAEFSDLVTLQTGATTANATLDETACNIPEYLVESSVESPLQAANGTESDHSTALLKFELPNIHHFTKKKFKYRPITKEGEEKFKREITLYNWQHIISIQDPSEAAAALTAALDDVVERCFPLVWVKYKSTDSPWIDKKLRRAIRRRRRIFKEEGRSERWKKAKKYTDALLKKNKKK